jgi:hypothetical protein
MAFRNGCLKVMLDRSVWHRMYQCLELGKCTEDFLVDDFRLLDNWLKNDRIEVVKFSIGDIENYYRKDSEPLDVEIGWLKSKESEYNANVYASTMYTDDINSPVDTVTVTVGMGDVDIPPNELNNIIYSYHISVKKRRDVLSLMISEKVHADLFIHFNPVDFERDSQIQSFITERSMTSRIVGLATAFEEIRIGRL